MRGAFRVDCNIGIGQSGYRISGIYDGIYGYKEVIFGMVRLRLDIRTL